MKIKINLTSGNVAQKPLVTCFKNNNGAYIVFDNEANGSMGLPIIAISKFNGTEAIKIIDQGEWAAVKESLKSIIANSTIEYLNVPEVISAHDDFFTQLTLPIASFEVLKNNYAPASATTPVSPVPETSPEMAPITPNTAPLTQGTEMFTPVMPEAMTIPATPMPNPIVGPEPTVIAPTTIESQIAPAVQENVGLQFPATGTNEDEIKQIKENFLNSCETMFDALVQKLQNK